MSLEKDIQRLTWRFSSGKSFTPNQNDINAINSVVDFYNQSQEKQFENNGLFAKLYIYLSMKIMQNDGSTVFENNHRRKIGNLLKKPLSQIIEDLTQSLNDSEQYGILKEAGHDFKHPVLRQKGEAKSVMDKLNKTLLETKNMDRLTGKVWQTEDVEQAIISEVNFMINEFN